MFLLLIPLLLFLYAIPTLLPIWRSYRWGHLKFQQGKEDFRYRKSLSALIPGDEGLPLFGIIFKLGRTSECLCLPSMLVIDRFLSAMPRRALELAKESVNKGEKIFKMWIMHDSLFIPMSGELLQVRFSSSGECSKIINIMLSERFRVERRDNERRWLWYSRAVAWNGTSYQVWLSRGSGLNVTFSFNIQPDHLIFLTFVFFFDTWTKL